MAPSSTWREGEWLVNPGSVGQPRDGDPRAAYLMLDTDTWTASFRRVEYPIDEAAKAIVDAGLPQSLADRLYQGPLAGPVRVLLVRRMPMASCADGRSRRGR